MPRQLCCGVRHRSLTREGFKIKYQPNFSLLKNNLIIILKLKSGHSSNQNLLQNISILPK
jgi:hypothetical protein